MTDAAESERLLRWLAERGWTYRTLAHELKWSPTFIYGALEGAWPFSASFRWAFARQFGLTAAAAIFEPALLVEPGANNVLPVE